jgi:hypothetical protein
MIRTHLSLFALALVTILTLGADDQGENLFNGTDLTGWKLVTPTAGGSWKVVSLVKLDPADDKKLISSGAGAPGDGVLLRADIGHGSDLYSEKSFGDCHVHVEFLIPKGSNSGVYLMGQYEVQILDTNGTPDDKLRPGDCGGIYHTQAPSTNAIKPPGEWQSYDIDFRAPRFDPAGKKIENAKFVRVMFNGKQIHANVEVLGPTGGELPGGEKATGPLMFQGNHGIVAFRNVRVQATQFN